MNHAQARGPTQHASALQAVLQFLVESGYVTTAECLEEESETKFDADLMEDTPSKLLTALSEYVEVREGAFKKEQIAPEIQVVTEWMHSLRDNPEPFAHHPLRTLQSHMSNVICAKFQPKEGSHLFAAGSADKSVAICDADKNVVVRRLHASGPVLCLHFNPARPELLLATCMNGGHTVFNVERDPEAISAVVDLHSAADASAASSSSAVRVAPSPSATSGAVLFSSVDHKKFVVTGKWSPDGKHYATGSHDFFVNIYTEDGSTWKQIKRIELSSQVEALEWVDSDSFYVSLREDNYLHHINHVSGSTTRINVNESGDDHVSFNVLDLSLSPNGLGMLLATDRHRVILLARAKTGGQVRNFYNVVNDGYSTPRLAWSPDGKYAYVTSQDRSVCVLEMTSGRTVHQIKGHEINVRDVAVQPHTGRILSCSFDKTCRVFDVEEKETPQVNVGAAAVAGAAATHPAPASQASASAAAASS